MIGRLLVAFGELEFAFCRNAGMALGNYITFSRMFYNLRATSSRIESADILMRPVFEAHKLEAEYVTSHAMVRHCFRIRNQFAHCNWGDAGYDHTAGLFFADLQTSAKRSDFDHSWKHVDVPLLESQEDYFGETLEWLDYVRHEIALRQGLLSSHFWPKPKELQPPPLHNPASQHMPP